MREVKILRLKSRIVILVLMKLALLFLLLFFLNPLVEFLKSENLKSWFPPLKNEEKFHDLCPSHLPFDKVLYLNTCTKGLPTEDLPNVSQDSDVQTDNRHEGTADTVGQLKEGTDTFDKKMTIWKYLQKKMLRLQVEQMVLQWMMMKLRLRRTHFEHST